jgi:hypothetical protein
LNSYFSLQIASKIKHAQSNCFSSRFREKCFVEQILSNRYCRTDFVNHFFIILWLKFVNHIVPKRLCQTHHIKQIFSKQISLSTIFFLVQNRIVQPLLLVVFKVRVWYADLCSCSHTLIDGENFQTELSSWGPYHRTFHNCNFCRINIHVRDEVRYLDKCQTSGAKQQGPFLRWLKYFYDSYQDLISMS